MEQMLELMKSIQEEIRAGQEQMMARMDANQAKAYHGNASVF
jgi:hypothetical protein